MQNYKLRVYTSIPIEALHYDVWYRKYNGLLKIIQQKCDHSPTTTVILTYNKTIVIKLLHGLHSIMFTMITVEYTGLIPLSGAIHARPLWEKTASYLIVTHGDHLVHR